MNKKYPLNKLNYINFPLSMLQKVWKDQELGLNQIVVKGATDLAERLHPEESRDIMSYRLLLNWGLFWNSKNGVQSVLQQSEAEINLYESKFMKDVSVNISVKYIHLLVNEQISVEQFCTICAIKSLIGTKLYIATTKETIKRRIFGCKNTSSLTQFCAESPEIAKKVERLTKRYHFDKLLNSILDEGYLKGRLGKQRRLVLSFKIPTKDLELYMRVSSI